MKAVKFPFRLDYQGHLDVATTYPELVRGQLIDVLMTNFMERVMRPTYGSDLRSALFGAVDDLVRSDAATQVATRVRDGAPRVVLQSLKFVDDETRPTLMHVDVLYRAGLFDEVQQLRMPVNRFLHAESEI